MVGQPRQDRDGYADVFTTGAGVVYTVVLGLGAVCAAAVFTPMFVRLAVVAVSGPANVWNLLDGTLARPRSVPRKQQKYPTKRNSAATLPGRVRLGDQ